MTKSPEQHQKTIDRLKKLFGIGRHHRTDMEITPRDIQKSQLEILVRQNPGRSKKRKHQ